MEAKNHRQRLLNWDYAQNGAYFVTFCTADKRCTLGKVINDDNDMFFEAFVELSTLGKICEEEAAETFSRFPAFKLSAIRIMPNHVHAYVEVVQGKTDGNQASLSRVIGAWKSATSRKARISGFTTPVWQKSFHDHIIRDETDSQRILEYIQNNPKKWHLDSLFVSE